MKSIDVVIAEPRPKDDLQQQYSGMVGLEELAKTDRILVQQVGILLAAVIAVCSRLINI